MSGFNFRYKMVFDGHKNPLVDKIISNVFNMYDVNYYLLKRSKEKT
jgi:hypothetical protein